MMDAIKLFFECVGIFFILYMIGYASFLFLAVSVGSSTLYQLKRRNQLKNELLQEFYVPVTIVVPAHNEEVTIVSTIRSLLCLEYKLYEIVIVDDGSTDNTAQLLIDAFEMKQIARPIHRMVPCQPEQAVFETQAFKVPITLICKKKRRQGRRPQHGHQCLQIPLLRLHGRRLCSAVRLAGKDRAPRPGGRHRSGGGRRGPPLQRR